MFASWVRQQKCSRLGYVNNLAILITPFCFPLEKFLWASMMKRGCALRNELPSPILWVATGLRSLSEMDVQFRKWRKQHGDIFTINMGK